MRYHEHTDKSPVGQHIPKTLLCSMRKPLQIIM